MLAAMAPRAFAQDMMDDINFFASLKDRSAGSPGSEQAADYVLQAFREAGLSEVGVQEFLSPVPESVSASVETEGESFEMHPWGPNLVYLPMTPPEGLTAPLIYVGNGDFDRFNGKAVNGSIVLMDMSSQGNWINASMLGASGLIFIGSEDSTAGEFQEKQSANPLAFPRYWVAPKTGERLKLLANERSPQATIKSKAVWRNKMLRNCYAFLPGKNPQRESELVILDAAYDSSSYVLGMAPGADEATSIAMLLSLARKFAKNPPERPVLFLAAIGDGRSITGMREFITTVASKKKRLKQALKRVKARKEKVDRAEEALEKGDPFSLTDPNEQELVLQFLVDKAKDKADAIIRETQYEKALSRGADSQQPFKQEADPRPYRHLSWVTSLKRLTPEQRPMALELLDEVKSDLHQQHREYKLRQRIAKSGEELREKMERYTPVLFFSLYLSSHAPYLGISEMGETYPVRENVRRIVRAGRLTNILTQLGAEVASEKGLPNMVKEPSRGGSSQADAVAAQQGAHPCCDVAVLAGLPAVALTTFEDRRTQWSTPHDTIDRVDGRNIDLLAEFTPSLMDRLISHPALSTASEKGMSGMATLEGDAMFIRQGELFPDQPAPGTIISILQGKTVFRAMVYQDGSFSIPGLANNRIALEKLILEPYGLDPVTGRVAMTADKAKTGKTNYRIKVKKDVASTSLIMFHCLQTDVVGIFNPQNMGYLTKLDILDATTEAQPLRYWYSRIDGRDTMSVSVFLEKGTKFKLVLAESLLSKELFLLNSTQENPNGSGFLIGSPLSIPLAPYQAAADLCTLLSNRLDNLSIHGISNHYLESLYAKARSHLDLARNAYGDKKFDGFWSNAVSAWATLDVIYSQVEKTQQDVLAGVMFFIALFVPFAYCVERYLFGFRNIYKQISAFCVILMTTILTIRALHPAFQLTYSPMVVILAFFIVGLSLLVSWIIFVRFEREMADLHSRTAHLKTPEVSKWQAFGAGFAIGVSNLGRRKLRTGLTCITLVILTFTVMSFTNVKSLHTTTHTRIADSAPYRGVLIRHQYRLPLTDLTLEDVKARFAGGSSSVWPRGWINAPNGIERTIAVVQGPKTTSPVEGILGLGDAAPQGFKSIIKYGRWFNPGEEDSVLIPLRMAGQLGMDPEKDLGTTVTIMGAPFKAVGFFDEDSLEALKDLDQNPVTPAYMEVSQGEELSEVEIEAMQSGLEILPSSERFRYADPDRTIIFPFEKCLEYGGTLRAVSILPPPNVEPLELADSLSSWLAFPLFVGDSATWYQSSNSTLRYQGVANLIIPILIVIFITLNTMIGHVHERQKEIATYTSVGLAPTHVGFLFIVEALSLAVISTVIGYIIAQLSAKYLGATAAFAQLTFNYSSLASVACMFLVFSIVFLASLYPARLAAEIAMPDVNRTWELPAPQGDVIFMSLPFLLKGEEEGGIMGFLHAFYSSHQDTADESFIVDNASMGVYEPQVATGGVVAPACLVISSKIWLAPFDFGIKQHLQLHCCASQDNPGYLEIVIQMRRLSGENSAWVRANKSFIQTMRKQMLLWRLLDREAKAQYSGMTMTPAVQAQ